MEFALSINFEFFFDVKSVYVLKLVAEKRSYCRDVSDYKRAMYTRKLQQICHYWLAKKPAGEKKKKDSPE